MPAKRRWYEVEGDITRVYGQGGEEDMIEVIDDDGKVHIRWVGHDYQVVRAKDPEMVELGDRIKFNTCAGEQVMYKAFDTWRSG